MNCSVDKIRMSIKIPTDEIKLLELKRNCGVLDFYSSSKISAYHCNYMLKEPVFDRLQNPFTGQTENTDIRGYNNVWFGFAPNCGSLSASWQKLTIEFNPNKTDLSFGVTKQLFDYYFRNFPVDIDQCDIAFDLFDVPIENLVYLKNRKRKVLDYRQDNGRTVYIGCRERSGFCKIYDKAVEQKIPDKIWSRVEFTFKINSSANNIFTDNFIFDCNVPDISFFDFQHCDKIDIVDKCLIYSVLDGFCAVDDFPRRTRIKLKNFITQHSLHNFTSDNVYQLSRACIRDYVKNTFTIT